MGDGPAVEGSPPQNPAPGDRIVTGSLFRLVPNWPTHWEYERGRPSQRAFRKDGDAGGVSMLRAERVSAADAIAPFPEFALCELEVAKIIADPAVSVIYDPDPDGGGDAHVLVRGITKKRIDWLRSLAEVRKHPRRPRPPGNPGDE